MNCCHTCGEELDPEVGPRPWCVEHSPYVALIRSQERCARRSLLEGSPDPIAKLDVLARLPAPLKALRETLGCSTETILSCGAFVHAGWVWKTVQHI